jgi:ribosomal protein L12E/L44/L45/RPP1/RPP2
MSITISQQKKHLLLLNRLHRTALKAELIPTPSKLSDDKIEKLFNEFFKKKDNYYIPKVSSTILKIDEEEFKKLYKEPKEKKEVKPMKQEEEKKKQEEEKKKQEEEKMKQEEEKKKQEESNQEEIFKNYGLKVKKINEDIKKNTDKYSPLIFKRMDEIIDERQKKGEKMNQGKVNRIRDNIIKKEFTEYTNIRDKLLELGEKIKEEVQNIIDNTKDRTKARELVSIYQKYGK